MLSADILAEGVSGLAPKPFGIATEKEKVSDDTCRCLSPLLPGVTEQHMLNDKSIQYSRLGT